MNSEVWKTAAVALLSALIGGTGSVVAMGRNSASRDYVDKRAERVEDKVEARLSSMERKIDSILMRLK